MKRHPDPAPLSTLYAGGVLKNVFRTELTIFYTFHYTSYLLCRQIIRCRSKENIDGYTAIRPSLLQGLGQYIVSNGMTRYITS
jgi:hypothetical protein